MHKTIVLFLLSISCVSYNMDFVFQQEKQKRKLILGAVLQGLYIESHFRIDKSGKKEYCGWHDEGVVRSFGRDIQALICTHSFFSQAFTPKIAKRLVTNIAKRRKYLCKKKVAYHLNPKGGVFHAITKEMGRLYDIVTDADKQFTQEDLQDPWYLNVRYQVSHSGLSHRTAKYKERDVTKPKRTEPKWRQLVEKSSPYTLLSLACKVMDFEKIEQLLAAGADCKNSINNYMLLEFAKKRSIPFGKHNNRKVHYFTMAQLLLENGADPDYPHAPTPLMIAAHNDDQNYALLLLYHFANPDYTTCTNIQQMEYPFWYAEDDAVQKSAYDLEQGEPKGWLKEMVDKIEKHRSFAFKYWFLKNYKIDFYGTMQNVPSDVIRLILYNVWESHKK